MDRRSRATEKKPNLLLIASAVLIFVLLSYGIYSVWFSERPDPSTPPVSEVPDVPIDEPEEPSEPLTPPELPGTLIVSVDNKFEARPHTGLEQADLVIEALAEWRITRLIAFYYTKAAPVIGPVRSTRYYGAQLIAPYNSPFAHAGGSTDGLQMVKDLGIPDMDEINNSGTAFWRDLARRAPHNLYTSTDLMLALAEQRNITLTPMPKLPLGLMPDGIEAPQIGIVYSTEYRVDWVWEEGAYHRYMNSLPHISSDNVPLTANNVIVVLVNHRDLVGSTWRTEMDLLGSGEAVFFRDGQAYIGRWIKDTANSHYEYTVDGKPFYYAPGNTWIQIVPNTDVFEF